MNLYLNITTRPKYLILQDKENISLDELGELIRYPFVPLESYSKNLSVSEKNKIKRIEDINIYYFFNALRIVFGASSSEESKIFQRKLSKEPLKTAILLSKTKPSPIEQYISFIENACKILLSAHKGYSKYENILTVSITGSMPHDFLVSRQEEGNKWYRDFIDSKFKMFEKICYIGLKDKAFQLLVTSLAYSIYYFTPSRFYIPNDINENDSIYIVLSTFINRLNIK